MGRDDRHRYKGAGGDFGCDGMFTFFIVIMASWMYVNITLIKAFTLNVFSSCTSDLSLNPDSITIQ